MQSSVAAQPGTPVHCSPSSVSPRVACATLSLRHIDAFASCDALVDLVSAFLDASSLWDVSRAARYGFGHLLRHLDAQQELSTHQLACAVQIAASVGHLHIIQWVHALSRVASGHCQPFSVAVMNLAACYGRLELLQWLQAHRSEGTTTKAMDGAACCGHVDVVAWLHEHRPEGCTADAMDSAAVNGHLDVVAFLHRHRVEGCTTRAMDIAAMNGDLAMLKFLHEHRPEGCTPMAIWNAARGSRFRLTHQSAQHSVAVLAFLYEKYPAMFQPSELQLCVRMGPPEVVEWIHAMGLLDVQSALNIQEEAEQA